MKKFIYTLLLAFALTSPSTFAADNFELYNKHVYTVLKPEVGLCDFAASFAGHEVEYSNVNDYFNGLISAQNVDLDNDGSDELITVESKNISVYTVENGTVVLCGTINYHLISNTGDSYANVFLKNDDGVNYIGVETFFVNSVQNCYQIEMFTLNKDKELVSKAHVYQIQSEDELYQSVSKDGVSIYSHTNGNGIISTMNPNNYSDIYAAAKITLDDAGITEGFLTRADKMEFDQGQYGTNHKLNEVLSDINVISYIVGTGVRTAEKPVVIFKDYSRLSEFLAEVFEISVTLNGEKITFADQTPIIKDGRTLVPVRIIFEALGADVSWLPNARKVVANTADTNITMTIDKSEYFVNGEKKQLDVPAMIINDRTLVPVRAISESLGCNVKWDDTTKTVVITQ